MQLYYKEYGEGPPLVILHGLLGSSGNWHTLATKAFGPRYHTFAVDLRNHGRSPHSDVFDYDAMVEDVVQFMDDRALPSARILGHSMGGKTAMHLALERPQRVDRLVVVDMAPRAYPPHHTTIFEALRGLDLDAYGSRQEIDTALAVYIPEPAVRQFLLKNLSLEEGRYRWQMNLEGLYRNYARLNTAVAPVRTFTGPTCFIRGGRSRYVADEDVPEIRSLFPRARLVTIPEAGHWVHAEAPEAFAAAVLGFLDGSA